MHALLFILFLVIIIFVFYVVYSFNSKGFSNYTSNEIWKSYPGKYQEGFINSPAPLLSSTGDYKSIDPFGLIDSSMKCPGTSYSSLNGNICLDDKQKMLLTTRGGNSKTGTKYENTNTK